MTVNITVTFYKGEKRINPFENVFTDPQVKVFADLDACMAWCRKNSSKIFCINNFRTFGESISHFEIMDAINGKGR